MLASSSWLGCDASLILEEAEENGLSRLQGELVDPCGLRNIASSSAGILVDDAREDRSPAFHQPPHAADRLFGLYRGGPRNGTAIVSLPTEQTNSKTNRAGKERKKLKITWLSLYMSKFKVKFLSVKTETTSCLTNPMPNYY